MKYNPVTLSLDENLITKNKITSLLKAAELQPYKMSNSGRVKNLKTGHGDFSIIKKDENTFIVEITTNQRTPSYSNKLKKAKELLSNYDNVTVR